MKHLLAAAVLTLTTVANASETPVGCPPGFAVTYVMQCDHGSRTDAQRFVFMQVPGVELCKVSTPTCEPVRSADPLARRGREVQDSFAPAPVLVTFGLDTLIGPRD